MVREGGGQPGYWGLPEVLSFWVTGLGEFPNAQRAAYLVTNCPHRMPDCQGTSLPPFCQWPLPCCPLL